ncbi:peptidylprolyl isomerase [Trifolium repens]|nr:peptidylprolyl isomerase [Trifolium repens]
MVKWLYIKVVFMEIIMQLRCLMLNADIKKSLELHPQNREVKVMKMKLKQLQADGDKKDAKLYENMFASKPKVVEIGKGS